MRAATSTSRPRPGDLVGPRRAAAGFTLIEMIVAMAILMIALLGLVASIAHGLSMSKKLRDMTDSKLTITSMLEQMETLRNTRRLTFGQIANTGLVNNTGASKTFPGFPVGFQPVSTIPGPDGIYGTGDDFVVAPGNDGKYGTSDDVTNNALTRPGYERDILITTLGTNLLRIQVTMRYPGPDGRRQTLTGISYLNNDASSNFR